jgi:cell division protein FtsB
MLTRHDNRNRSTLCRNGILLVAALASGTILFVGKKVELETTARRVLQVENRTAALQQERARLNASIIFLQKPGAIEQIARGHLNMDYASGRNSDLSLDSGSGESLE